MLAIVGAGVEADPGRAEAAVALGRVAAGADEALGLFGRVDHRADDAVAAGIEHLHDDPGLVPGHPGERRDGAARDRLEQRQRDIVAERPVLQVDGQAVPALRRHDLGGKAVRQLQPAVDRGAALAPDLPQPIGPHGTSPAGDDAGASLAQERRLRKGRASLAPGPGGGASGIPGGSRTRRRRPARESVQVLRFRLRSRARQDRLAAQLRSTCGPTRRLNSPARAGPLAKCVTSGGKNGIAEGAPSMITDLAAMRQRLCRGRPDRGGSAGRPDRAVRALVRGRPAGRAARAQRDDAGHGRRRRSAGGAHRPAQGGRPARARLLHQSRPAARPGARRQPQGGAGFLVGAAGAAGALRGRRSSRSTRRRPTPISRAGRAAARSAPGHRRRAASCRTARRSRRRRDATSNGSPPAPCRGPSSGAACAWCRSAPSSGRARATGCTTGCATSGAPMVAG